MAREITVPRLGWTMEEGTFGGWLKADGDVVREGDELFLLESDKASEAITALDAGTLRVAPDGPTKGDTVRVGQCLGHLLEEGEAAPTEGPVPVAASVSPVASSPAPATDAPTLVAGGRRRASPRARRVARELGVELAWIVG